MSFQNFPQTNVWGSKFDLAVKGQKSIYDHHTLSPQCYILQFRQSFLASGEKDLKVFLLYMGMAAIL